MIPFLPPAQVQAPPIAVPRTVEVRPGLFVVQGEPGEDTFAALKAAGITHVINLRKDSEGDFAAEAAAAAKAGSSYGRCPMDREPSPESLDAFRSRMRALPKGARVLVHCASGNRVAGALYTYWVLDEGMEAGKALALAKQAGLSSQATEAAAKAYVQERSH